MDAVTTERTRAIGEYNLKWEPSSPFAVWVQFPGCRMDHWHQISRGLAQCLSNGQFEPWVGDAR